MPRFCRRPDYNGMSWKGAQSSSASVFWWSVLTQPVKTSVLAALCMLVGSIYTVIQHWFLLTDVNIHLYTRENVNSDMVSFRIHCEVSEHYCSYFYQWKNWRKEISVKVFSWFWGFLCKFRLRKLSFNTLHFVNTWQTLPIYYVENVFQSFLLHLNFFSPSLYRALSCPIQ